MFEQRENISRRFLLTEWTAKLLLGRFDHRLQKPLTKTVQARKSFWSVVVFKANGTLEKFLFKFVQQLQRRHLKLNKDNRKSVIVLNISAKSCCTQCTIIKNENKFYLFFELHI